jgi:hypothetical protein
MRLVRELEEEPLTPYARRRHREWMLGDGIDEGADSVVSTTCRWDDKKSFLLRTFEVKTAGDVVEGAWTQVDDRWVIKSSGFRSDGRTVSATQIVTPLQSGVGSLESGVRRSTMPAVVCDSGLQTPVSRLGVAAA